MPITPAKTKTPETPVPSAQRFKRGISFNIYLPYDELYLKDEYEKLAQAENRSISEVVIAVLRDHLDKKRK